MALKVNSSRKPDSAIDDQDVSRELEEALALDLTGDLDMDASMEDLEAQISQAAEELAREGRGDVQPAPAAPVLEQHAAPEQPRSEASMQFDPIAGATEDDTLDLDHTLIFSDTHDAAAPVAPQAAAAVMEHRADIQPKPQPAAKIEAANVEPAAVPLSRTADPAPAASPVFAPANDRFKSQSTAVERIAERRPSRAGYWGATILSTAWVGGGVLLANALYGPQFWQPSSYPEMLANPSVIGVAAGTVLPVMLFWAFAVMTRRAQEMRIAAQSISEVARRLAEPETIAQDRVMMVGQAIRREVTAMGEGIERTLARAVELETLVHTEVNELERAYSENETRIRSLVDGLGAEREAVVSHAERVRASIAGAHEQLKEELGQAGSMISGNIHDASARLAASLNESGNTLLATFNDRGEQVKSAIDSRLDTISERITTSGEAFAGLLDTRIATLGEKTDGANRALADMLDERTGGIVSLLGGATRALSEEFELKLGGIEKTLAERGQSLIGAFESRAEALDSNAERLNTALEARARSINETLMARTRDIAGTFASGKQDLITVIDEGKARIGSDMADLVLSTSSMLETRAADFSGRLAATREDLSANLDEDLRKLEEARTRIDLSLGDARAALSSATDNTRFVIEDALGDATAHLQATLGDASTRLSDLVREAATAVETQFRTGEVSLGTSLGGATDRVEAALGDATTRLDDLIRNAADAVEARFRAGETSIDASTLR